jgi:catechol 2,3-dioxygenase-like lactoylglutathione lyase family enzyme
MKLEFHHINYVTNDVDSLHNFYTKILGLTDIPAEAFPRPEATSTSGYDGKIRFATDGKFQMHLATKDLNVAFKNGEVINPVAHSIPYSDYGTAFAEEWHQVFFHDPEGNVIEVHQAVRMTET